MARILAIDYGTKRTGVAATDPLQIIATGIGTVPTESIFDFLDQYLRGEAVETIVVGDPKYPDGNPAQIAHLVLGFSRKLRERYPGIEVVLHDERFTSEEAKSIIRQSGVGRKKRQDKALVDKISAVLILQDFLEHKREQGFRPLDPG